VELNLGAFTSEGETTQEHKSIVTGESVFTTHSFLQNQRNRNQFISLEASRFLPKSQLPDAFRGQYQIMRLDDLVSIRRVQHIEITSDPKAILCSEISSDDINEFGILGPGKKKYVTQSSERRLENSRLMKGDILLCIRGPVGKVALVRDEPSIPLVSTQNFLRLRLRDDCESKVMTPEFLYWWLRSDLCQGLIKNFEIAAGVMRLSMRDIDELEVPVGPDELLRVEIEKYQRYDECLQEFLDYEGRVRQLAGKAFI
jgi:restriction endonuclease S subunit